MKFIICCLLLVFFFQLNAQQNHFIYLQTESQQPFYIKLDSKVFSSSSSGYLIIPKLKNGNYNLIVGFPKNEWPEQTLNLSIDKDAGYLLKATTGKGWQLTDLQSSNTLILTAKQDGDKTVEQNRTDNFSDMLATVVNDSTIKQKDVVEKVEKKEVEKPKEIKTDTLITSDKKNNDAVIRNDTISVVKEISKINEEPLQERNSYKEEKIIPVLYSSIRKKLQNKNKNGIELVYTDSYNDIKDTIRVFIPADKNKEKAEAILHQQTDTINKVEVNKVVPAETVLTQIPASIKPQSKAEEPKHDSIINKTEIGADTSYIASENQNKKSDSITITTKDKSDFLPSKAGMTNTNCKAYATHEDFLKLRKKMAAESNDDDMISAAKKLFKSKCFTTNDIKNLSVLFLNDQGKYSFFDAAYPYVSDADIFYTLQDMLSDQYYIRRFKAMINQ